MSKINSKILRVFLLLTLLVPLPAHAQIPPAIAERFADLVAFAEGAGHSIQYEAAADLGDQVVLQNLTISERLDAQSSVNTRLSTARAVLALDEAGRLILNLPEPVIFQAAPTSSAERDLVIDLPPLPPATLTSANGITLIWDQTTQRLDGNAAGGVLFAMGAVELRSTRFEMSSLMDAANAHDVNLGSVRGSVSEGALAQFGLEDVALTITDWGARVRADFSAATALASTQPMAGFAHILGLGNAARLGLSLQDGTWTFDETATHLSTDFSAKDIRLGAEIGDQIPILWQIGAAEFGASAPLLEASGGDFALRLAVQDAMPEAAVWNWLDRDARLPRVGGGIDLDLTGALGPAKEGGLGLPFWLDHLTINAAELNGAGLDIRAEGGLDLRDGAPPSRITLEAEGLFTFLEALTQSGHLDNGQFAMIIGALDLFATRAEGEDRLDTAIDLTPEGKVTIGGMPLQ